jgi:dipeptidyl aminopeptidase/acylaminoacyl peptidase
MRRTNPFNQRINMRNPTSLTRKPVALVYFLVLLGMLCAVPSALPQSQPDPSQSARAGRDESPQQRGGGRRGAQQQRGVYKARITPHWFHDNTRFWYRNDLKGNTSEFILVDAEKGTRAPAFDHEKLAAALSKAADVKYQGDKLPFTSIEFSDDGKSVQFTVADKTWKCDLASYECVPVKSDGSSAMNLPVEPSSLLADAQSDEAPIPNEGPLWDDATGPDANAAASPAAGGADDFPAPQQDQQTTRGRGRGQSNETRERSSPDGKWTAFIRDSNVYLRPADGGAEIQLTQDGETNDYYGRLSWSPDSLALVAWRIEPGDDGQVYLIQSSPPGGGRAVMTSRSYPQAGDKFTAYELSVFDIANRKQIKPAVDRVDFRTPFARWNDNAHRFTFEKEDRGHQRFRIIAIDALTGADQTLLDEQAKTFIWTDNTDAFRGQLQLTYYLEQTNAIIYESERDGWRHLYLVDLTTGAMSQITKGQWLVRGVDRIDEDNRQIWFEAGGMFPGQDPYYVQYCRINFDGTGLVVLTDGDGDHTISYSPDRKYIIDTYSRVDMAPVNELRRVSDGKLVCKLEETEISELRATGWKPPVIFVAKGRDGTTDIYGIIDFPRDLNPRKKYPVLEDIYAGPQGTPSVDVPTTFSGTDRHGSYNSNGFIVVKIAGMGTANRSKAFQDVCWHNLADAGFPDRILWMEAAAKKYPCLDLTRVGIFGTSAGGQNAAAAVLFHPEFYKVAVANCGCHDNRIDKATWNEQWMGYLPHEKIWSNDPDNWFSKCSNIDNAWRLKGKLFLIVGEQDHNVPPESTLRFVDALIKAHKDFDLLVVPGADHGAASPVTQRRTQDFFVHNLLHQEPPDRNGGTAAMN